MTKLALVANDSSVRIRTFAEGLFARLAHDLELVCRNVTGSAEEGRVSLEVPIADIDVNGTLKGGHVDPKGLSASDRKDALAKMRHEVFHSPGAVKVEGTREGDKARLRIVPPNGRALERTVNVRISEDGPKTRVSGKVDVSLSAIGSDTVKGPMNAFRVKDTVEVLFDLAFGPA